MSFSSGILCGSNVVIDLYGNIRAENINGPISWNAINSVMTLSNLSPIVDDVLSNIAWTDLSNVTTYSSQHGTGTLVGVV